MVTPKDQAAEQRKKFNTSAIDAEIALFDTEKSRFWYDPKTVLENLKAFAEVTGSTKIFRKDYKVWPHRVVSAETVCQMFGSWENACQQAGLTPRKAYLYSDMELLNHYEAVWRYFKQRPSKGNMVAYNKRFGTSVTYQTYSRRWGGFREFGERFADYKLGKIRLDELLTNPNPYTRVGLSASLRAKVLERDRYTCRDCGASPRKDPEVSLHIHHILPVSQGGKDEMSNLITNCSDCNQGKSDVIVNNELFE